MDATYLRRCVGTEQRRVDASSANLFSGGFLKVILFRMVTTVVSFSWFCLRKCFAFLVWVVSAFVLRVNARISSRRDGRRSLLTEEDETEPSILDPFVFDEMNVKDQEDSSFKFRFRFDFPEDIRRSMEKPHRTREVFEVADVKYGPEKSTVEKKITPETATLVNNYRFVSEKNITGFVVDPEEVTCRYQESVVVEQQDDDHIWVSEENNKQLKDRLVSPKNFDYSDEDVASNWESISKKSKGFSFPVTEDLCSSNVMVEKMSFQPSNDDVISVTSVFKFEQMRGIDQSNSDDGTAASHLPMLDEFVNNLNPHKSNPVVLSKLNDVVSKKSKSVTMHNKDRLVSGKDFSSRSCFLSEEDFNTMRSDFHSLSEGYSVKSMQLVSQSGKESPFGMVVLPAVSEDLEPLYSSQLEGNITKVSQPVVMNAKVGLVGGNVPYGGSSEEDYYAIASDSYSPNSSCSDGYSVKSLEIVTESDDGFLSDGDDSKSTCTNFEEANLSSVETEKYQDFSEIFENYVADSVDSFDEFSKERDEFNACAEKLDQVIQEADLVISRLSSINQTEPELGEFPEINLHINNLEYSPSDNELHDFEREEETLPGNIQADETPSLDEVFTFLENDSTSYFMTRNRNSDQILYKQGSPDQSPEEDEDQVASLPLKDDEGKQGLNEQKHSDEVESEEVTFTSTEVLFPHSLKVSPETCGDRFFHSFEDDAKCFHEDDMLEKHLSYYEEDILEKDLSYCEEDILEKEDLRFYEEVDPEKRPGIVKGDFDELIEQLSMELINSKSITLPTILEEPESPIVDEDLKKWNFDVAFLHEKPIDEVQKMYKKYKDGMRKLDILRNQKMHAIDVLHIKDTIESLSSQKPSIASILSQSFFPCQRRKSKNDLDNFIKELRNDLEVVYVGQTCLSWEFLSWQFEKSRELQLPASDPYRIHQYNRVANEFQNFQVLIQRFVEDEAFQVPRVSYYVKSRLDLSNLLQVPVIQEDSWKYKADVKKNDDKSIMIDELENIMANSIRTFWQFVKADKDFTSRILKELVGIQAELQERGDLELLVDIQADLRKKERKLKDMLKVGNCLVKKFKKPNEQRSSQDLFFSQVDLKLVSRVLELPRITTDQLVWCYLKLRNITFVDRKIHREPSFFIFPCSSST